MLYTALRQRYNIWMSKVCQNKLLEQLPEGIRHCAGLFARAGYGLYAVGGWVRDSLAGLPAKDIDLCSDAPTEEAEEIFAQCGYRTIDRHTELGTMSLCSDDEEYEYTRFRRESYAPGGHHRPVEVAFDAALADDALRRDFTVNALYLKLDTGELIDPFGGVEHIEQKKLMTCRAPEDTFGDDGLRLLRMVRFAVTRGYKVAAEVMRQAKAHKNLLADISQERFRAELGQILLCPQALEGLHMMDECGFMTVLIPELEDCRGFGQNPQYHDFDVLEHMYHACARANADETDRWAALLHDIGKPESMRRQGNMHIHAQLGADTAGDILRRLKYPRAFAEQVARLVGAHMYDLNGNTRVRKLRWFFVRMGISDARRLVELRRADVCGSSRVPHPGDPALGWCEIIDELERDGTPLTLNELAVNGADIMAELALPPGPMLGQVLGNLHRYAVDDPKRNRMDTLLRRAAQIIKE